MPPLSPDASSRPPSSPDASSPLIHITPRGFNPDPWHGRPVVTTASLKETPMAEVSAAVLRLDGTTQVEDMRPWLGHITAISIDFPSSQDGRGFSLARKLRDLGYGGGLRAEGRLHVDQFRHALQAGFDAVVITPDEALRMPEGEWQEAAQYALPSYQSRFIKAHPNT